MFEFTVEEAVLVLLAMSEYSIKSTEYHVRMRDLILDMNDVLVSSGIEQCPLMVTLDSLSAYYVPEDMTACLN